MSKTCDVCGAPSGMYPLCQKCFVLRDKKLVAKCQNCGKWFEVNKGCGCGGEKKKADDKFASKKKDFSFTKKAIILKEEPNNDISTTDVRKKWEAGLQCDDGHYVRSYSEVLIDNWLYHNGYVHAYEKSVFMPSNPEETILSDFYLPQGDVYIEFWGLNNDKYSNRKEHKIQLYEKNNLNLINLEESDIKRLNDIMPRLLHNFIKK